MNDQPNPTSAPSRPVQPYKYLGNFSAVDPAYSRGMQCHDCRVEWTGCWDNFVCPQCGQGELPSCEPFGNSEKLPTPTPPQPAPEPTQGSAREWLERDDREWPLPIHAQRIVFEGCDSVTMSPEAYLALYNDALVLAQRVDQHDTWIRILEGRLKKVRAQLAATEANARDWKIDAESHSARARKAEEQRDTMRDQAQAEAHDCRILQAKLADTLIESAYRLNALMKATHERNVATDQLAAAQARITELEVVLGQLHDAALGKVHPSKMSPVIKALNPNTNETK